MSGKGLERESFLCIALQTIPQPLAVHWANPAMVYCLVLYTPEPNLNFGRKWSLWLLLLVQSISVSGRKARDVAYCVLQKRYPANLIVPSALFPFLSAGRRSHFVLLPSNINPLIA
ncbi:MAG: hypothetical protein ACYC63_16650, partial [Armatimonadota bacterium]